MSKLRETESGLVYFAAEYSKRRMRQFKWIGAGVILVTMTAVAEPLTYSASSEDPVATTVTVSTDSSQIAAGQNMGLEAQVSCNTSCGYVSWYLNGVWLGTSNLDSTGHVHGATQPDVPVGTYNIVVVYSGDANYLPSTSNIATFVIGQAGGSGNSPGALSCFPSTVDSGGNTTCSVGLVSGATGTVAFTLDGQPSTIASPNGLGLVNVLIDLASASVASHTVSYSYPGDGINPPMSGNATVAVEAPGSTIPNQSMIYQFSITQPDGSSGFAPNGNVIGYLDSVNGMWSQIQYDGLNRLISAQVTPPTTSLQASYFCWSFDNWGNRTGQTLSNEAFLSNGQQPCQPATGATSSFSQFLYSNTNQLVYGTWQSQQGAFVTGIPAYDSSGNMTNDLQNQYLYDAEGRVCAVQVPSAPSLPSRMIQYLYDAEGHRVGKGTITQWSCDSDNNGFSLTSEYILDQGGKQVTEVDGSSNGGKPIHTNAYAQGQLIATFDDLGTHYQLADWLGTRRVQVSPAGVIEETCQSLPFGDQLNCAQSGVSTADDATEHHFTGKERDTESGLDYFGARYYGSTMGRFMSPDWNSEPEAIPYADLRNPQSLNLYAYVNNNPLRMADPDGHDGEEDDDDEGDPQATITAPAPTAPSPVGVEPEIPGGGVLGLLPLIYYDLKGIGEIINPSVHAGEDTRGKVDNPRTTPPDPQGAHRKDARPSTKGKHQKGQGRKKKDKGGEKGDQRRQQNGMFPRKPPPGNKGPWPPRDFNEFVPVPVPPPDKPKKDTHGDG